MRVRDLNPAFNPDNEFLSIMLSMFDHVLETLKVQEISKDNIKMEDGIRGAVNVYSRPLVTFIRELLTFEKVNPYTIRSFKDLAESFCQIINPEAGYRDAMDLVTALDSNTSTALLTITPAQDLYINKELTINVPSDASMVATWRLERGL